MYGAPPNIKLLKSTNLFLQYFFFQKGAKYSELLTLLSWGEMFAVIRGRFSKSTKFFPAKNKVLENKSPKKNFFF